MTAIGADGKVVELNEEDDEENDVEYVPPEANWDEDENEAKSVKPSEGADEEGEAEAEDESQEEEDKPISMEELLDADRSMHE